MRLIDANELKIDYGFTYDDITPTHEEMYALIDRQPTIDAVPAVRCADCKHSVSWYRDRLLCYMWSETGIAVFEDGFCNYGERKQS